MKELTKTEKRVQWLRARYDDLEVGWDEDIDAMTVDQLEQLVDALEQAQQRGELDLETDEGVDHLRYLVEYYQDTPHTLSGNNGWDKYTIEEMLEEYKFETIVNYMDPWPLERIHADIAPCGNDEFLAEYLRYSGLIIG